MAISRSLAGASGLYGIVPISTASSIGYLWQGRFASFVMEEPYLLAAARYVELNPVRAKLVARAEDWPWSRARAHLSGRGDSLVKVAPWLAMVHDWQAFLD